MKKILFFRDLLYTGGTEIAMLNLISQLKGYELYVGYSDETSEKSLLDKFACYAKVININSKIDIEFDCIVACIAGRNLMPYLQGIKRKKLVFWIHYPLKLSTSPLNIEEECAKIDEIIAVSETSKQKIISSSPLIANKIRTINNLLNKEEIIAKSKIPIDLKLSSTLNLVTVARVCEAKGFGRMVHLAECLKEANIDFKWFIIGDNYYSEQTIEIKNKFEKFKDNFEWFGFLDNPHNIVKMCDYSVLLSSNETWGLVLTEAMILNVPCIVTDFDVAFEQIKDKENGIILSKDNLDSYKIRLDDIVNNKEKYKKNLNNYNYNNKKILKEWSEIFK